MQRLVHRIQRMDVWLVCYVNRQWKSRMMDWLMCRLTHLGGAFCTITFLVVWWLFTSSPMKQWAVEGFAALAGSHLAVRACKHYLPRIRPHLRLSELYAFPDALTDYSFPSGHTTAAFSIATVFVLHAPWSAAIWLPLACLIGLSRMYLALHYPTDVVMGAVLGTGFALGACALLGAG
ncbi:phosphatase PAP2 family protein [Polycladomyces sp. WAk]|uniref:Phosphatase PAP2 family protein n=1 Tax=Polycladomyces zharkentensis TaxID=2807616 RepID=A0ABS2WFU8_9BACL|nr:phosphatase PAP2 family protein [Polycladomyces sp. WAk]MBN2908424.1 phosphatase PAP2 family protein [Polycladomyces sp. WAk]